MTAGLTLARRRDADGWLLLSATSEARFATFEQAQRFLADLERAEAHAAQANERHADDMRRVLQLAQHGLARFGSLRPTIARLHAESLDRIAQAHEEQELAR